MIAILFSSIMTIGSSMWQPPPALFTIHEALIYGSVPEAGDCAMFKVVGQQLENEKKTVSVKLIKVPCPNTVTTTKPSIEIIQW